MVPVVGADVAGIAVVAVVEIGEEAVVVPLVAGVPVGAAGEGEHEVMITSIAATTCGRFMPSG